MKVQRPRLVSRLPAAVLVLSVLLSSLFVFSPFPNQVIRCLQGEGALPGENNQGGLAAVIGNSENSAASLSSVRTELMATKQKDVEKLLNKYSLTAFKGSTANFWHKCACVYKYIMLWQAWKSMRTLLPTFRYQPQSVCVCVCVCVCV